MSRSKDPIMTPADMPQILPAKAAELVVLQDAAPSVGQMDAVLAAGIDIGRIDALDFVATVANSAILPIYENVKKSKAWQFLRNPKSGDGRHFESLSEFCEVKLGKSYKRLRELTANRNLIGHEAYDQAEKMGLRQVDYNAIKALPAPDQELIRQAVAASSRDEVLDLLQELASRHAQVAAALTKDLDDSKKEKTAVEKVLEFKNKQIDQLQLVQALPPNEQLPELQKTATGMMHETLGQIRGKLRQAFLALNDHPSATDNSVFMAGLLGQIQREVNALRTEYNLPDVSSAEEQAVMAAAAQWAIKKS